MAFTVTDIRSDIDALLATAVDAATWTTAMKDAAVRRALVSYSEIGPVHEQDVTVTVAGHEQDLSGVSGLLRIEAIAWPWYDGEVFERCTVHWRRVHPGVVRFDSVAPQVGDTLRVRMRIAHTVSGLDGAAATNVPDTDRSLLGAGAAAEVLALRLRQISENPALPREAAAQIKAVEAHWRTIFVRGLLELASCPPFPVWSEVGL